MSNVSYLVRRIKQAVPIEVLERAFETNQYSRRIRRNIDTRIENEIINGIVLMDCDIVAGIETTIKLSNCVISEVAEGVTINVPHSVTGGREITSALSITNGYYSDRSYSDMEELTNSLLGGDGNNTLATANMVPLGNNTIFVATRVLSTAGHLRVVLSNDKGFANINKRALMKLSTLCIMATKAFIYRKLRISMSDASVRGGISLSVMSDVVSEYSDMQELYDEMLSTKWRSTALQQDRVSHMGILDIISMGRGK